VKVSRLSCRSFTWQLYHVVALGFLSGALFLTACAIAVPTAPAQPVATGSAAPTSAARAPLRLRATRTPRPTITAVPTGAAPSLTHGPLVGAVKENSARVFARTNQAAQVAIQYGVQPGLNDAVTTPAQQTSPAHDFTTLVSLQSLSPATTYYLNVLVGGKPQLTAPYPKFKTFPAPDTAAPLKWVMLTDFSYKPSPAFARAAAENPDFVVIGGDFDHSNPDTLDAKRDMFKQLYDPQGVRGDLVKFILRQFAVMHMWDDHDLGVNNADRTYTGKALALQVLQEYFPVYPLTQYGDCCQSPLGDWQKFSYGTTADFFLLDARSQRDPDTIPDGPGKSMLDGEHLGDAGQLTWLKDGLRQSHATWKFIVTPVPFNRNLPKPDAWAGFRYERGQLVNFIRDNHIGGVIFISGDIHAGGMDDGTNSDFPEMLVPSVNFETCMTVAQRGEWSHGWYGAKRDPQHCSGYGVITVETNPDRVTLQVKDVQGKVQLEHQVIKEAK
jgi:alkaline phosphatase D